MGIVSRLLQNKGFQTIFGFSFKCLDLIWKKDNKLAIFSSMYGKGYADNSRFLFEKFSDEYSNELRSVWLSSNKHLVAELKQQYPDRNFEYLYSKEGIMMLLLSRYEFSSYLSDYIPGILFSKRTISVHLKHGIPIKSVLGGVNRNTEKESQRIKKWVQRRFTYWINSSTIDRNSTAICTGLPLNRMIVTGYPRNDYIIDQLKSHSSELHKEFPFLQKKIILYAPTWRTDSKAQFLPFDDLDLKELNSFLEIYDSYLLLRGHLVDDTLKWHGDMDYDWIKENRIILANRDKFNDVQELLPFVDILISDYSGIWVDYLLLDRPIIFIPYDIEQYKEDPGLLYDYDRITPGPKIDRFQELMKVLKEYMNDPSKDSDRRKFIRCIFHEYEDGLAYKRIFELVMKHSQSSFRKK